MQNCELSPRRPARREALRRMATLAAGAFLGAALRGEARGAQAQRPNILFIAIEDLRPRLRCYGEEYMVTPNIDRLAARGVRFDRAYVQGPVCNPSRNCLITGCRPYTTKIYGNADGSFRKVMPDFITLPEHFRNHGYWLARTGKIYHGGNEDDRGWDAAVDHPAVPQELRRKAKIFAQGGHPIDLKYPNDKKKRMALGRGGSPLIWRAIDGPDESQPDFHIAEQAIAFLKQRPKDRPFFVCAGFHKPHLPFVAPKKYFDLYSLDDIELAPVPEQFRDQMKSPRWNEGVDDKTAKQLILAYQACISFVDAQVGRVLDALDELGLAENTIVLLWGDHGWHLTDHGRWRKGTLYEVADRIPLIVSAPGKKRGVGCLGLVETVDIYPTLAELCGLPQPARVEAISFAPLLDDPQRRWKKGAFTYIRTGTRVRTERFRYSESNQGRLVELYDLENDPGEWFNLAQDPKYADVVAEHRKLLHGDWKACLPER